MIKSAQGWITMLAETMYHRKIDFPFSVNM